MSLSIHFRFIEKDDVPFAIERVGNRLFRMDGRAMSRWVEVDDSDARCRIMFYGSQISESEALLLADEFAEDIADASS